MAYVVNPGSGTVTPIRTATGTAGPPIRVGSGPVAIAVTPDGRNAYVTGQTADAVGLVTPIRVSAGTLGRPIRVGPEQENEPFEIVITPDGRIAYVLNFISDPGTGIITPIRIAANTAGKAIREGAGRQVRLRRRLRVSRNAPGTPGHTVTPIRIATNTPGKPIKVGIYPIAIAIVPARPT